MQPISDIQLVLLPGLGGDHRMLQHQRALPFRVITPDYIAWTSGESLEHYAQRFAESIAPLIDPGKPVHVGGVSLGGAIALELSEALHARSVILVGSLLSNRELRSVIRSFGKYIAPHLPLWAYRAATQLIPFVMLQVSGVPKKEIDLAVDMYSKLPKGMFRAGYAAICRWEGHPTSIPLLRIHSDDDHILPLRQCTNVKYVLPGGRHLVAITRPAEVNRAIEHFIREIEGESIDPTL